MKGLVVKPAALAVGHMVCLNCDNTKFEEKIVDLEVGDDMISTEAFVCSNCEEHIMTSEQMDKLRELVQNL